MIKETFYKNKGKLEVESLDSNERKIFIFDYDKKKFFVQDLVASTCQSSQIKENNQDFLEHFTFWDLKAKMTGVTVLFNRLIKGPRVS